MAYRKSTRRTSSRARSGYSRRSGYSTRRRASVRRRAAPARRRSYGGRGGGQTVRLVIEHATPGAQSPEAMMLPQVQATTRKAKF